MKVCINRRPKLDQAFGGGLHFVNAFCDVACQRRHEVVHSLDSDIDAIVAIDARPGELGIGIDQIERFKSEHPSVRVLFRVNECDAKRGRIGEMDSLVEHMSSVSDDVVFVSRWMKSHHAERGCSPRRSHVIVNGVDRTVFKPCDPSAKLSRQNGKVNVVTAHWSDNAMKGEAYHEWLDAFVAEHSDQFTYTFIGRTNAWLSNTNHIDPLPPSQLAVELARYDVCVNASQFDPGPNAVLESVACGLPTYVHVNGGGGLEFAGMLHSFDSFDQLERLLLSRRFLPNAATPLRSWEECVDDYLGVLARQSTMSRESAEQGDELAIDDTRTTARRAHVEPQTMGEKDG